MQLIGSVEYNLEKLGDVSYDDQSQMYDHVVSLNKSVYGGAGKQRYNEMGNYDETKVRRLAELIKSTQDTEKAYAIWTNPDFTDEQVRENDEWYAEEEVKAEKEKAKKKAEKEAEERVQKKAEVETPEDNLIERRVGSSTY